jgi:hypothetical protein
LNSLSGDLTQMLKATTTMQGQRKCMETIEKRWESMS